MTKSEMPLSMKKDWYGSQRERAFAILMGIPFSLLVLRKIQIFHTFLPPLSYYHRVSASDCQIPKGFLSDFYYENPIIHNIRIHRIL